MYIQASQNVGNTNYEQVSFFFGVEKTCTVIRKSLWTTIGAIFKKLILPMQPGTLSVCMKDDVRKSVRNA